MDPDRHIAQLRDRLAAFGDVRSHARGTTEFLLGLALAEHPGADAHSHREAIGHYAEALRVFDAARFPIERARTYIALGASERALGMSPIARERFDVARELLGGDVGPDLGAAENNLGLTLEDSGDLAGAAEAFERALGVFAKLDAARQEASAQQNLGRTLSAMGDMDRAERAFRRAVELTTPEDDGPLWASHAHALAVHLIENGGTDAQLEEAVALLESALTVFTRAHHPFQHAMAKYNMGLARLALADHGDPAGVEVRLALAAFEDAVAVFDPRLHATEWRAADQGISEVSGRLGGDIDRTAEFVALLVRLPDETRRRVLFERLARLWETPEPARTSLLRDLDRALTRVPEEAQSGLARDWMRFLTEHSFEHAAEALTMRTQSLAELEGSARSRAVAGVEAALRDLEVLIRVQVRSLLEAAGYERPEGVP